MGLEGRQHAQLVTLLPLPLDTVKNRSLGTQSDPAVKQYSFETAKQPTPGRTNHLTSRMAFRI